MKPISKWNDVMWFWSPNFPQISLLFFGVFTEVTASVLEFHGRIIPLNVSVAFDKFPECKKYEKALIYI
jgi:hypothetical protein